MNSHEVFIHIHQGCFAGTGAIVRLPQCQWSKPDGYGKISQCITTTKQKTCAYFLGYTVWQHSTASTLAHVIACCLKAPSHYPDQCWLISKVPWHSSGVIVIRYEDTNQVHKIEYYIFQNHIQIPQAQMCDSIEFPTNAMLGNSVSNLLCISTLQNLSLHLV